MTISRSVLLRMRNVLDEIKTHFVFSNIFFFFEILTVYEIMSKNLVEPERPQTTIWLIRFACWISKGTCAQTHTHALGTHTPASNYAHTHTHACTYTQKYVIFSFTATAVWWTRLSVTLYLYCLSCFEMCCHGITQSRQRIRTKLIITASNFYSEIANLWLKRESSFFCGLM